MIITEKKPYKEILEQFDNEEKIPDIIHLAGIK